MRGERDEIIGDSKTVKKNTEDHERKDKTVYESVDVARIEKGDEWSGFRYTL